MKKIFLYILLILSAPSILFADELSDRKLIEDRVSMMFMGEQFDELSKLSKHYLESGERTSSGIWKLSLFYVGIVKEANTKNTEEKYWSFLEDKALLWVKTQPNSPSGYLAYAKFLERHAWMYRGGSWASKVKPESWKPFYTYIEKAKKYLIENKNIASNDPAWYVTMLEIAKAEGWNEQDFESLVNEATSRYPFFYPIYFAAVDYLLPKWHGSKEEIEQFAQKAVTTTALKDKKGMYARIYWYASQTNYGSALFTDSAVVWGMMSSSIDDVLAQYPDQWNINNFAYFSCLAKDKNKTNALIKQIKNEPILKVWKDAKFYNQCKSWAKA